ncbi:hypothetical protein SCLCIDRAFT_1217777 [Scleroderma citrinum Foug A]|uniref:Uncharacterized protein n=1 Tax=Scleroderma citrinum Foug A TaxID=1036808 RepID=A0A0C3A406_9AGAM|nr:hypothetical protein SCLCIDRAFT_1217777 [Scleroderma citrinum Foug A]
MAVPLLYEGYTSYDSRRFASQSTRISDARTLPCAGVNVSTTDLVNGTMLDCRAETARLLACHSMYKRHYYF